MFGLRARCIPIALLLPLSGSASIAWSAPSDGSAAAAPIVTAVAADRAVVDEAGPTEPTSDEQVPADPPRPALLIVHAPSLADSARTWGDYRRSDGYDVELLEAPDTADQLLERIRTWARSLPTVDGPTSSGQRVDGPTVHGQPVTDQPADGQTVSDRRIAVLLLGDVSDPPLAPGAEAFVSRPGDPFIGIPTFSFDQPDPKLIDRMNPRFVSDHPYQRLDDADELPDLALGRVPARSNDEALRILDKVRRYEHSDDGDWRHRVNFLAGEGRFGLGDTVMESLFRRMVDVMVPPTFEISVTYAHPTSPYCPPPSQLESTFSRRIREGALLVNYLGHGSSRGFDRMRWGEQRIAMLTSAAVEAMTEPGDRLPIAFLGCCSSGWYDRVLGAPSLAESMLLAPGGPIAVIAGSRPTHPYGTAVLQKDLTRGLLETRVEMRVGTIGELDLAATRGMLELDNDDRVLDALVAPIASIGRWPCTLPQLRLMHVRMFNLLGDPATRIAHPAPTVEIQFDGRFLRGDHLGALDGSVEIVVETPRDQCVSGPLVNRVNRDDPELELHARETYSRANERTLWRGQAELRSGSFVQEMPVDDTALWRRAGIIRCVISGGENDRTFRRLGAIRLAPPAAASVVPAHPVTPTGSAESSASPAPAVSHPLPSSPTPSSDLTP